MTRNEFLSQWLQSFACGIPKKDIEKHVKSKGNYIWHIFSWELLSENQYLIRNEARMAYDKVDKKDAIYVDFFEDKNPKDITCDLKNAKALDDFVEIYVVGKDFEWTYIKTHEGDLCGPYFMQRNII